MTVWVVRAAVVGAVVALSLGGPRARVAEAIVAPQPNPYCLYVPTHCVFLPQEALRVVLVAGGSP